MKKLDFEPFLNFCHAWQSVWITAKKEMGQPEKVLDCFPWLYIEALPLQYSFDLSRCNKVFTQIAITWSKKTLRI